MKRLLATMLAVLLLVTLIPPGLVRVANAAPSSTATYFIPDNTLIRKTAALDPMATSGTAQLTRTSAFTTNGGNLTITGAFSHVTANSMTVKIEQLNLNANSTWTTDPSHFTTGTVLADANSTNRFTASNLTLFSGMNRITFSGNEGNLQRSDVFYVLFDQIPYIQSLKVTSGSSLVDLNEGTQVVVPTASVSLQGVAKNATKVTSGVNGGSQMVTTVYDDGSFFTPAMTLKAGLNTVNLTITNGSNTINVVRQIYFFDQNNPFTDVNLIRMEPGKTLYPLTNNVPQITYGTGNTLTPPQTASMQVQMLIRDSDAPTGFAGTGSYSINSTSVFTTVYASDVKADIVIPGQDGNPQYRLVTFELPNVFPLQDDGIKYKKDQIHNLTVKVGNYQATFQAKFKYLPGETAIVNMEYLPKYSGSGPVADRQPLNNAEVSSPSFYVLVKGSSTNTTYLDDLKGVLLPFSGASFTIGTAIDKSTATGLGDDERIYKISAFPNGQQKVQFSLHDSASTFIVNISYISKSYIYVANLFDGQEIKLDSKQSNTVDVSGSFLGFNGVVATPQYFVNGIEYLDTDSTITTDPTFKSVVQGSGNFNLKLAVTNNGPLVFGENRIVFKGTNDIGNGNKQDIIKEVRIYITDKNLSLIQDFMPTLNVSTRQPFFSEDLTTYTQKQMSDIFSVAPEFLLKDNKYFTSETSYDLVIRGSGATIMNLKLGSQVIFTKNIPLDGDPAASKLVIGQPFTSPVDNVTYTYDFAGDEDDFIFRVRAIPFAAPGTHVYNLELINGTGARTNQTLEITREVSAYRILSPQPTVGNQIIVNKNFVRFDIEAEGATDVLIEGQKATKRSDMNDRFVYDYVGLKPDKLSEIKIQIKRADSTLNDKIQVFYTSTVQIDSQYMEKLGTKHSVFNKGLQLTFPKGTVLQSVNVNSLMAPKLYNDTKLLFGIANATDGVVERKNDYGNIINVDFDARTSQGKSQIIIPDRIALRFANNTNTSNFTRISPIYWISGGEGELGNRGDIGYKPATNGLPPYSIEGNFTEYEAGRKVVPSKRGTLTIAFDGSVVEDVSYTVTVFRYTDAGSWENVGGEVNTKARTITVPFDDFGYYQVVKLRKGYNDVTNHGWARNILNALYSKGIMTNMRVDEFGANDLTTRGEFATLIVKGLNLPLKSEGNQTFFDITPNTRSATWDYDHIETAARAGIVNGLSEGFFGPDIRITREDAAVMIAKALQLKMSINNSKLESNLAKAFVDSGSVSYYARPAVEAVNKAKIMTGSATTIPGQAKPLTSFNPKGYMTRAEAGKIAVALLLKNTSIFPKNLS
ncbi:S-layer homology domain-containing protein [Cohnella yongneupensis]|uniref:S-layer homology domain-containing protein n=1 Tax=Cohnella yongneupensis TaxID=425006 RepID=A0ABW0R2T6_9BACL